MVLSAAAGISNGPNGLPDEDVSVFASHLDQALLVEISGPSLNIRMINLTEKVQCHGRSKTSLPSNVNIFPLTLSFRFVNTQVRPIPTPFNTSP